MVVLGYVASRLMRILGAPHACNPVFILHHTASLIRLILLRPLTQLHILPIPRRHLGCVLGSQESCLRLSNGKEKHPFQEGFIFVAA